MSYQSEVLADSPVLFWVDTGGTGTSVSDLSGNTFTGTLHGTFTRGVSLGTGWAGVSPGITLGGAATDFIDVASQTALNITGAVTYECVVVPNLANLNTLYSTMSKGYTSGSADQGYVLYLQDSGGSKRENFATAFSGTGLAASAAGSIVNGTTYHLVATRDGSNVNTVYINGAQAAQATVAATLGANTQPFAAGVAYGGGTPAFPYKGTIAAVAVYNTALSAARVSAHYAARDIAPSVPLVATTYAFAV